MPMGDADKVEVPAVSIITYGFLGIYAMSSSYDGVRTERKERMFIQSHCFH